jgi:ferrous iron transport protein A
MRTALDLRPGELASIAALADNAIAPMRMELGCLPGRSVRLLRKGLPGGPHLFAVEGRVLAFRLQEAATLQLSEKP